jgi:hypothetical protein
MPQEVLVASLQVIFMFNLESDTVISWRGCYEVRRYGRLEVAGENVSEVGLTVGFKSLLELARADSGMQRSSDR